MTEQTITIIRSWQIFCHILFNLPVSVVIFQQNASLHTPSILILTVPRRYFCCGSLLLLVFAVRIYTLVQLLC